MSTLTFEQWLQSRLTAHGFPVGPIDGVIGPTTTKAIRAFEAAKGMPVDGKADDKVVAALRLPASAVSDALKATLPDRDATPVDVRPSPRSIWPRQSEVPAFFGKVGETQTSIEIPFDMFLAWDKSARVRKMTLHRKVAASALHVLEQTAVDYSASERTALGLHLFGGSLNVRRMRGGSAYSMHSWGIAIDFDPERNQLSWKRPRARLSHPDADLFWRRWEAEGWVSLGRVRDFDWMHVQAARL